MIFLVLKTIKKKLKEKTINQNNRKIDEKSK